MDASTRLLRLLSLLQTRPMWSGPDLAARLGVTTRTVRRDMGRLRDLGYPVDSDVGAHGGYRLVAGGALPPLLLDDEEAMAVAMALRSAAGGTLPGFEDSAIAALVKIEQVLPARLRARVESVAGQTVRLAGRPPGTRPMDIQALVTVAQACRGLERLRFRYTDGGGRASERHVEPLQVVHAGRRWYLVAWDRDREAWRSFRIDRMTKPVATGMRVTRRDAPDPAEFVAEGLAVGAYRFAALVLLRVPVAKARAMIPRTVGVLEPADGGALMRIGADDLDWIARFLASLECRFTVLDPPELRDGIRALAARLSEDAGDPG